MAITLKHIKILLALGILALAIISYFPLLKPANSVETDASSNHEPLPPDVMPEFPVLYSSQGLLQADVIYHEPSLYGDVVVFDYDGTRCFLIDGANESCWTFSSRSPSEYVSDTAFMLENSPTTGKEVLIIGMGAGTLMKTLEGKGYSFDAVDINEQMPAVAEKYFGLSSDENITIYVDDGRHYLETTDKKYDAIILDICYVNSHNAHLWTEEFYALAKQHLKDKNSFIAASMGIVNNESNITLENKIANAMSKSFSDISIINRGELLSGQFDMAVFYATNNSSVTFPSREPAPQKWVLNDQYAPASDVHLDEFVTLFYPATEAIIAQTKINFGDELLSPGIRR